MSQKLKMIPLCQLRWSKENMRKTNRLADIEPLAASILANGVLQSLLVEPQDRDGRDGPLYDVTAGGRRLAALKLLAKRNRIERDAPVPCLVKGNGACATEISLAENFVRVPPHPADQFEAFANLARHNVSVAEIASRFGISETFVEQRLKLASVSPRLLAEYRAGAMTLDQLTAFTLSDSHHLQEEVWFERGFAEMSPQTIRRLLTSTQIPGTDPRARFIGAKAYESAGGMLIRDLFDAEDEGYFSNSQLLDRLVHDKLAGEAQNILQEGWQWVEIHAEADLALLAHFGRAPTVETVLSDGEQARLSELAARYDELVAALEEGDERHANELDAIDREMAELDAKRVTWLPEAKGNAGAIVSLGQSGVEIHRGLLKPGHKDESSEQNGALQAKKGGNGHGGYADSVLLDLSAHRTAAMRELMAQQPQTARLALLHVLVSRLFYPGLGQSCLCIRASQTDLDRASESVRESRAAEAFVARHGTWQAKLPDADQLWDWLCRLESSEQEVLLAHCVALTIDALKGGADPGQISVLAAALGLDMRTWWQPTQKNFLGRLTKNDILAAVSEGVSQQASWRLASLKKDRMAKEAERLLAGSGWLPAPLRLAVSNSDGVKV
jgi:ParB family chromosome partitioning protein